MLNRPLKYTHFGITGLISCKKRNKSLHIVSYVANNIFAKNKIYSQKIGPQPDHPFRFASFTMQLHAVLRALR